MIFYSCLSLTLTLASIQTGGELEEKFTMYGNPFSGAHLGNLVASAGDLNGDGYGEIAIASAGQSVLIIAPSSGTLVHAWYADYVLQGFGSSVKAIPDFDGDGVVDYLIGAYNDNTSGHSAGAVFVYSGATGARVAEFFGPFPDAYFGWSADSPGDLDSDGIPDLVVGAATAGSVYFISGATGVVLRKIDEPVSGSGLGVSVLCVGDLNGDGVEDLAAGMAKESAVWVLSGSDGTILHTLQGTTFSTFGSSIARLNDLDMDGVPEILVGAPQLIGRGGISIFSGFSGELLHAIVGPGPRWFNYDFGRAVSGAGDVDGDGFEDFVVGSPRHNPGGMEAAGSAYLYSGRTFALLRHLPGYDFRSDFGTSVAGVGDLDADGFGDFLVSAPREDAGVFEDNFGAVHAYGFHPFLYIDTPSVSASSGGTVQLTLRFPEETALYQYQVLLSESSDGAVSLGVDIPLKRGALLANSYQGNYPFPNQADMQGTLNASAEATASFHLPAGLPGALIGQTFWFAAIAHPAGQMPEYSSIAVPIEIVP